MTIAEDVAVLLARKRCGEPTAEDGVIEVAVETVTAMARAYTRGRGFDQLTGEPNQDVTAAIVTAAARLAANPRQLGSEMPAGAGAVIAYRGGFTGWSMAELFALNRWRVRAQ